MKVKRGLRELRQTDPLLYQLWREKPFRQEMKQYRRQQKEMMAAIVMKSPIEMEMSARHTQTLDWMRNWSK